ncbi:MAG: patatin-like phospholipase family protein [Hyphomicrobiales bacterium]
MIGFQKLAAVLTAALLLWGCGASVDYISVPQSQVDDAKVVGFSKIRFWGDTGGEDLAAHMNERWEQSKSRYGRLSRASRSGRFTLALLSISGGGANGSFGAGVLNGWTKKGDRPQFEAVTGISTGALIAPYAFLGTTYDEQLEAVYTTISTKDVLRKKGIGGVLTGTSYADSTPLYNLISSHVTPELLQKIAKEHKKGRRLWVGTTNLEAGRPVIWDMGKIAASGHPEALTLFRKILLASASIPGAFPPVPINVTVDDVAYQEVHVDGGTTNQAFLYPGQLRATRRMKRAPKAIPKVYIIRNAKVRPEWKKVEGQTLAIAARAVDTLLTSQGDADMYKIFAITKRDGFDFNLAYIPLEFEFPKSEPFDNAYMNALYDTGYNVGLGGKSWIKNPYGF